MSKTSFFKNRDKKTKTALSSTDKKDSRDKQSLNFSIDKDIDDIKSMIDTSFVLKDINPPKLDRDFNMRDLYNYNFRNKSISKNETPNDLENVRTNLINLGISDKVKEPTITFIEKNNAVGMYTSFNDTYGNINRIFLNKNLNYKCWHCKNNIPNDWIPISLPLKYYQSYIESYIIDNRNINQVKKLEYTLKEKIPINNLDKENIFYDIKYLTSKEREDYEKNPKTDKSKLVKKEYFDGEGIFCSFNCMLSFQHENNSKNVKYKDTAALIYLLYFYIFDKYPDNIIKASNWKMLKEFGGDQTIEEFRKNFSIVSFSDLNQYIRRMPYGPVSELFLEEKSK